MGKRLLAIEKNCNVQKTNHNTGTKTVSSHSLKLKLMVYNPHDPWFTQPEELLL